MRIKINQVQGLMIKAFRLGYIPELSINGEYYDIDYMEKLPSLYKRTPIRKNTEVNQVKQNGGY